MDFQLILILAFALVMVSIVASKVTNIVNRSLEHRERIKGAGSAQYEDRMGELEERVRVLERIATDGRKDPAAQIEELRTTEPLIAAPANALDGGQFNRQQQA